MRKLLSVLALAASLCGCMSAYKGGTASDGTSLTIGLKTPITSTGTTTLQVLSYINGMVISWEDDVDVQITRDQSETLNAFGIWESSKTNHTQMVLRQPVTNTLERVEK